MKKNPIFSIGDVVLLKSDLQKKCPMIVINIFERFSDEEKSIIYLYQCQWQTAAKNIETNGFNEKCLNLYVSEN